MGQYTVTMTIAMQVEVSGIEAENASDAENQVSERLENGCTICGTVGIGFPTEFSFVSQDGSIDAVDFEASEIL